MSLDKLSASLHTILRNRSVQHGSFTLASGKQSSVYVDARLTTMSPEGMKVIGQLGLAHLQRLSWNADSIGGLTLGADPVAYAIAHESALLDKPIRAFTVRKQAKEHGTGKQIEGPFNSGDHVVIAEDVITTGKSAFQAIDAVTRAGGTVVGVLAVVDRQEGGAEALSTAGYPVVALASMRSLIEG